LKCVIYLVMRCNTSAQILACIGLIRICTNPLELTNFRESRCSCVVSTKWIKMCDSAVRCFRLLSVELCLVAVSNVGRDEEVRRGGGVGGRSGRRDEPRRHTLSGDHHQQGGALARSMDLEVSVVTLHSEASEQSGVGDDILTWAK
jgi:hypothetical protein